MRSRAWAPAPSSRSRSRSRATSSSPASGRGCRACSPRSGASPRSSGPAIGGLITTTVGWRVGVRDQHPGRDRRGRDHRVRRCTSTFERRAAPDRLARARLLLTGSIVLLLFAVSGGGAAFGWLSPLTIGLLASRVRRCSRGSSPTSATRPEPLIDLGLAAGAAGPRGARDRHAVGRRHVRADDLRPADGPGRARRVAARRRRRGGARCRSAGRSVRSSRAACCVRTGARPIVLTGTALLVVGALLVTQLSRFDALRVRRRRVRAHRPRHGPHVDDAPGRDPGRGHVGPPGGRDGPRPVQPDDRRRRRRRASWAAS